MKGNSALVVIAMTFAVTIMCNIAGASKGTEVKIRFIFGAEELIGTMDGNEASRDFISMLPLTLSMKDFAGTEKISDRLSKSLSVSGSPSGYDPTVGDIAFYAPWGNLALFYRDSRYATGLVRLGHFNQGIEKLGAIREIFEIKIEKIK